MKINLTKKEYSVLLELIYISDWVLHSHEVDPSKKTSSHRQLRKKLLSYFKEMGAEDSIEHSKSSDDYYETRQFEERCHEDYLVPYNEETFWEELVDRITVNRLVKKLGIENFNALEGSERLLKMHEMSVELEKLFEEQGLNCLTIKELEGEHKNVGDPFVIQRI